MKMYNRKNLAFTLSEVLITLSIIGIIAVLTIPNLMGEYRKKVIETRLAKFYSVMNQAIIQSEADNGPKEYWDDIGHGFVTDEDGNEDRTQSLSMNWYNKYLKNYLVVLDAKINTNNNGKVMLYFPDGSLCIFSSASFMFWPVANDFSDWDDESLTTNDNLKTLSGRKMFTFLFSPNSNNIYHYKKGLEPYKAGWDGERETLLNKSNIGCNETATNHQAYCAALIQMNGWKIPDDYPFKF